MTSVLSLSKKGCETMPLIFGLTIIFIIWFQLEKRKSSKEETIQKDSFLKRENESNLSRKQDISKLDYITLSTTNLPITPGKDEATNQFINTYLSYIDKKIINLSHYSNTELKEQYGLVNLNILSEYDENFFSLTKLLDDWGTHLWNINCPNDAIKVLELALSIKTEITNSYLTLATVYGKLQHPEKVASVKAAYSSLSAKPSEKVLAQLDKVVFQSLIETDCNLDETIV